MSASESEDTPEPSTPPVADEVSFTRLPFPPYKRSHILHCGYASWYQLYRAVSPKARVLPLVAEFVEYLKEDGIVLPDDDLDARPVSTDDDSGIFSVDRDDDSDEDANAFLDPSDRFRELLLQMRDTIAELGGKIAPKLDWSAPKDATWISATNSMQCNTISEICLLLKSSDFVSHDLEHAFEGCEDEFEEPLQMQYHLVLRKWVEVNPSVEFRCFVRGRRLLAMTQRDLNHFDFLFPMVGQLTELIEDFFSEKLQHTFPDDNFVFDVYIPAPHKRVWLVDINPFAARTDPLLFSWLEILQLPFEGDRPDEPPELRLVKRDDPEAYAFTSPQYSAHKLPKDVVDASLAGPGPLREFADQWKELVEQQERQQRDHQEEEEA